MFLQSNLNILNEYSSPFLLNSILSLKLASLCSQPPWSMFFGRTVTNQCSPWPRSEQNFIIILANWYRSGPARKYYTALSLNMLISSGEKPCISMTFRACRSSSNGNENFSSCRRRLYRPIRRLISLAHSWPSFYCKSYRS